MSDRTDMAYEAYNATALELGCQYCGIMPDDGHIYHMCECEATLTPEQCKQYGGACDDRCIQRFYK